jgi:D-alanyl-lipoteichoic acid acyltransferase DltB (MBOAT superfamily)
VLFPTLNFGLFFLALFALVWSARENEWRKIILLAGSWVFYGAWDWRFVALLIGSAFVNWAAARLISRARWPWLGTVILALAVTTNLLVLGVFKYYGFFVSQAAGVLALVGWTHDLPFVRVILPVGVSFFTFQGVSYVVDVARGKLKPARLLDVMLLMSFFAHLVAGPIVRGSDLIPQFQSAPRLTREDASRGLVLIVWGLFKKVVIASQLAIILVDPVFLDPGGHGALDLLGGVYGYAIQIYCDFSAYSDMAIGLALLLGYRFPQNFDQPYRATSLQDFWRRWHISLSSWLRDYLYIPLGGSRGGLGFVCRNLFLTMLLGGLWHGAAWNFVIWGALHGLGLCAERLIRAWWPKLKTGPVLGWLLTFHFVCLGWIFFRAESFQSALDLILRLFTARGGAQLLTPYAVLLIGAGLLVNLAPSGWLETMARRAARLPAPVYAIAIALAVLAIDAERPAGVAPFIYYQF